MVAKKTILEITYRDATNTPVTVFPTSWEFVKDGGGIVKLHWEASDTKISVIDKTFSMHSGTKDEWIGPSALMHIQEVDEK